ncbi:hypothetical protein Tco_0701088 [Tanacetum coccineum]
MGKDTIQLENAVSTISQEYLLKFTSECGIPEGLHPELPGPEDTIVDFSKGKVVIGAAKRVFPTVVDWCASTPKDGMPTVGSYSAEDVTVLDTHQMDLFNLISAPNPTKVKTRTRPRAAHEVPLLTVTASRVIDMEDPTAATESSGTPSTIKNDEADANAPPKVLRKNHADARPEQSTHRGKSLASIGLEAGTTCVTPATQEALSGAKSVSDRIRSPMRDHNRTLSETWLSKSSKEMALEISSEHVATTGAQGQTLMESPEQVALGSQLRLKFKQEARLLKKATAKIAKQDQRIQAREEYIKKLKQETSSLRTVDTEVQGLRNQAMNLETLLEAGAQVTGEERLKAAFEEFKKYEDERVNSRCAKMGARLEKLSVDFDEELYMHMLTAIAVAPRLLGTACMSEGLKYGVEHGKAGRDLADIEAYDPEANSKLIKALQDLKDLKYLMVDQLEKLRDAPMELIMASLHLESDTGEDAPQWIRDLRPSTSQLKIPVYLEKKKKCRVVCRTHGVGSAHHARSNGVPISAPTIAPQGLVILLADASTQTEISEGEASPRLLRSMSLPVMYNLDWP